VGQFSAKAADDIARRTLGAIPKSGADPAWAERERKALRHDLAGGPMSAPFSFVTLLRDRLAEIPRDAPEEDKRTYAQHLVDMTIAAAILGDIHARKLCFEYIEGLPKKTIETTVEVNIHEVSESELDREIRVLYERLEATPEGQRALAAAKLPARTGRKAPVGPQQAQRGQGGRHGKPDTPSVS